ncbi:hypothetical protein [Streptomyces sp. AC627_RSS907]|uniref:hypothetical protein n=1 Tax=Streptomyces sp. AC627_RSS907 TaxID=2823684 RepID=UPI001C2340D8|nr:hypothetical protein [Streptomyces sp. AC627_RSS907]
MTGPSAAGPGHFRPGSRPGGRWQWPGRPAARERHGHGPAELTGEAVIGGGGAHLLDGGAHLLGGTDAAVPLEEPAPVTSAPPPGNRPQVGTRAGESTEPLLRVLPLGGGLVLIGLGLALAFVGLRLRRV